MKDSLLSFEDIHFAYSPAGKQVIHNLSLSVEENSITAILGPNGSGKTTLLYLALGWLKPFAGQIKLEGKALQTYTRRELGQRLGLVPQNEHIPFEFSLLEYVILGRSPHLKSLEMPGDKDYQIAMEALQRVGMADLYNRSISHLSGGEQQLVTVARALAQQPRFLLLDEPTAHLDLNNKIRLITLLGELAASGVTVLLTTHEPELAAAIGTHLVLMRDGMVLHQGTIQHILTDDALSETYCVPVRVRELDGKKVVLWM
jgi:iron complex transport system ATP-binding protein